MSPKHEPEVRRAIQRDARIIIDGLVWALYRKGHITDADLDEDDKCLRVCLERAEITNGPAR